MRKSCESYSNGPTKNKSNMETVLSPNALLQTFMGQPLVTILTPVFNGGEYLRECVESILAQSYENWEYFIVNNCSSDATLEIASEYAKRDSRIRVVNNDRFLNVAENHNKAFGCVSEISDYVKVVSADDWISPECLEKMVRFAMENPSVGVLCCYQKSGTTVRWQELPVSMQKLQGRAACRMALLQGVAVFGAPTAFLYRADLFRKGRDFFTNSAPHADTSACYVSLQYCDYGVVPEILAVERVHDGQISSKIERFSAGSLAYLEVFLQYGPRYLTQEEFRKRTRDVFAVFYRFLGGCVWKFKGADFWEFQRSRLAELGCRLSWGRVAFAAVMEAVREMRHPGVAFGKLREALRERREFRREK